MARPIRNTPILYGRDAEDFLRRVKEVDEIHTEIDPQATRAAFETSAEEVNRLILTLQ